MKVYKLLYMDNLYKLKYLNYKRKYIDLKQDQYINKNLLYLANGDYIIRNDNLLENFNYNEIGKETINEIDNCDLIYDEVNKFYNGYYIIKNLIDDDLCDRIINEGIKIAKDEGWTLNRHSNYPTTDNSILENWESYNILKEKTESIIFDKLHEKFGIDKNKLKINELFLSKYDGDNSNKQNKLDFHKDASEFSFVISLNDSYEGGGTFFKDINKNIKLKKGECVIFCGQRYHSGSEVTKGKRYVVAGFINYVKCDYIRDEMENDEDEDDDGNNEMLFENQY